MTTKQLSFKGPPQLAIAARATSPNPGINGVQVWSTTENALMFWDGNSWGLVVGSTISISSTAPANPYVNQLWIQI